MRKSFHTSGKTDHIIETGNNALGNFFCCVLSAIVIYWLCADTVHKTEPVHIFRASHDTPGSDSSTLNLLLDWL